MTTRTRRIGLMLVAALAVAGAGCSSDDPETQPIITAPAEAIRPLVFRVSDGVVDDLPRESTSVTLSTRSPLEPSDDEVADLLAAFGLVVPAEMTGRSGSFEGWFAEIGEGGSLFVAADPALPWRINGPNSPSDPEADIFAIEDASAEAQQVWSSIGIPLDGMDVVARESGRGFVVSARGRTGESLDGVNFVMEFNLVGRMTQASGQFILPEAADAVPLLSAEDALAALGRQRTDESLRAAGLDPDKVSPDDLGDVLEVVIVEAELRLFPPSAGSAERIPTYRFIDDQGRPWVVAAVSG
jgi:hypothetical protein